MGLLKYISHILDSLRGSSQRKVILLSVQSPPFCECNPSKSADVKALEAAAKPPGVHELPQFATYEIQRGLVNILLRRRLKLFFTFCYTLILF